MTSAFIAARPLRGRSGGPAARPESDIYSLGVVLFQMLAGNLDRALTTDWQSEVADPVLRADLRRMLAGTPERRSSVPKSGHKSPRRPPAPAGRMRQTSTRP